MRFFCVYLIVPEESTNFIQIISRIWEIRREVVMGINYANKQNLFVNDGVKKLTNVKRTNWIVQRNKK